jgi:hypothetical protein
MSLNYEERFVAASLADVADGEIFTIEFDTREQLEKAARVYERFGCEVEKAPFRPILTVKACLRHKAN